MCIPNFKTFMFLIKSGDRITRIQSSIKKCLRDDFSYFKTPQISFTSKPLATPVYCYSSIAVPKERPTRIRAFNCLHKTDVSFIL